LSIVEVAHSGPLDRADMNENVLTAVVRLNESEASSAVEPLHGSRRQPFLSICVHSTRVHGGRASAAQLVEIKDECR